MLRIVFAVGLMLCVLAGCQESGEPKPSNETGIAPPSRPNILLVVLDDVGFNDLSLAGSEIPTPTLDALAADGVLLTSFHVAPNCSPTRAMLLSGTDNHIAGLGNMAEELAPNQTGQPGYEGHLNFRVAALPEVLKDAGFRTYLTGKWHLGLTEETSPVARGFERSFALLQGGAGAFDNMLSIVGPDKAMYRRDGALLESLPEGFYSTEFYTDEMIRYIDSGRDDGQPFFAYLAYTAPHWPLQAPEASIARHRGAYDDGYDALRERRLEALKARGLVSADVDAFPRFPAQPSWDALSAEEQQIAARTMEVYAAMVDDVDRHLGRLIAHLKTIGEYDNTFIFFMSDNGPEAHELEVGWDALAEWVAACCDNTLDNIGRADSYVWYGPNWGQSGNTPLRLYKGYTAQGGVRVPAIAHYPAAFAGGGRSDAVLSVMDVMPTILDVAGVTPPEGRFRGRDVVAMQGRSLLPMLRGEVASPHSDDYAIGWELFGKRAIRQGDWKIIYRPDHPLYEATPMQIQNGRWQLYNLQDDPRELVDLSEQHPDKLANMIALWDDYAQRNGVILPDAASGY